eukprot:3992116-Amphidinium_carterae.1
MQTLGTSSHGDAKIDANDAGQQGSIVAVSLGHSCPTTQTLMHPESDDMPRTHGSAFVLRK